MTAPTDYERLCQENIRRYGEDTWYTELLEGLYTERTHFILELLQNAEDKKARRIRFDLFSDRLEVRHDGTSFDEGDVRGICGIGKSTKKGDLTQIGKFGIGFKSVYAFTEAPEIHSGSEHFRISTYVRPHGIPSREISTEWTTLFVLPFTRTEVVPVVCEREIGERLAKLDVRTMLFLRHIKEILWWREVGGEGCYLREHDTDGAARRVMLVGQNNLSEEEEHWLVFEAPVCAGTTTEPLRIEAAFRLAKDEKSAREEVVRTENAVLTVFFPTRTETHLGFIIQGPYRTTLGRDNIPSDVEWNQRLVNETAALVARSLVRLRDLNFVTPNLFAALPLRPSEFPADSMFRPIFNAVAEAFMTEDLIPTDTGSYVTAADARLSRGAELRMLFPSERLTKLLGAPNRLAWVIGEITQDRTSDIYNYLRSVLGVEELAPETVVRRLDREFLEAATDDWLLQFFEYLEDQKALWREPRWKGDAPGPLRILPIIRLRGGSHVEPFKSDGSPNAYLTAPENMRVPLVSAVIIEHERARAFLKALGLGDFDVIAEIRDKIIPRYAAGCAVPVMEHLEHMKSVSRALQTVSTVKNAVLVALLRETAFVLSQNATTGRVAYKKPTDVYVSSADLAMYFLENDAAWFTSSVYEEGTIEALEQVGVSQTIRVREPQRTVDWKGNAILANDYGHHRRGLNGFDPDFDVDGLRHALTHPTPERSLYIWNNIAIPHVNHIRGTVESSSYKDYRNARATEMLSKLGAAMTECRWLPFQGKFVQPSAISLDDLPVEFSRDDVLAVRLAMKTNDFAALAKKVGVAVDDIVLLKELRADPEEYERVRTWLQAKAKRPQFPVENPVNRERRVERLKEEIATAPRKEYENVSRSTRSSSPAYDPRPWLREKYTTHGQMVCQICHDEMPFKKRDGQHYFEAVEILDNLPIEHQALYIALCPVCAAKYKEFVKTDDGAMRELANGLRQAARPEVELQLGQDRARLCFVETHILDLKTLLTELVHPTS